MFHFNSLLTLRHIPRELSNGNADRDVKIDYDVILHEVQTNDYTSLWEALANLHKTIYLLHWCQVASATKGNDVKVTF